MLQEEYNQIHLALDGDTEMNNNASIFIRNSINSITVKSKTTKSEVTTVGGNFGGGIYGSEMNCSQLLSTKTAMPGSNGRINSEKVQSQNKQHSDAKYSLSMSPPKNKFIKPIGETSIIEEQPTNQEIETTP